MSTWLQDWATIVTTLALVVVTAWYAWLTRRTARSAEQSAASARDAAESARQAAAASVAAVQVDFAVNPVYLGEYFSGVTIRCLGATVYVHGATLIYATEEIEEVGEIDSFMGVQLTLSGNTRWDFTLPLRLHKEESLTFDLPWDRKAITQVISLRVDVLYSLDRQAQPTPRSVTWHDQTRGFRQPDSEDVDFPEL